MEIAPQMVDMLTDLLAHYAMRTARLERQLGVALRVAEAALTPYTGEASPEKSA